MGPRLFLVLLLFVPALARADGEVPKSAFFNVGGVKIHYLVKGQGEPVVLIHGLYASALRNWVYPGIFSALAKDHEVVALDLPGHGMSDHPTNPSAYGEQMVDDVRELMDHLKIKRAQVVGYSLGGIIALRFIVEHPERVISGTLGGMGWLQEGGDLQQKWETRDALPFSRTPSVLLQSVARLALTEDQIKAVKVPVEMIVGERDPTRTRYIAPLQTVRPDWPVVVVPDAGHINCVTKPEFLDDLTQWLDAHRGA